MMCFKEMQHQQVQEGSLAACFNRDSSNHRYPGAPQNTYYCGFRLVGRINDYRLKLVHEQWGESPNKAILAR